MYFGLFPWPCPIFTENAHRPRVSIILVKYGCYSFTRLESETKYDKHQSPVRHNQKTWKSQMPENA